MVEFSLSLGEGNTLETAIALFSLNSVLQGVFLIIVAITVAKYIRKENAHPRKRKHSQNHHRKRR